MNGKVGTNYILWYISVGYKIISTQYIFAFAFAFYFPDFRTPFSSIEILRAKLYPLM